MNPGPARRGRRHARRGCARRGTSNLPYGEYRPADGPAQRSGAGEIPAGAFMAKTPQSQKPLPTLPSLNPSTEHCCVCGGHDRITSDFPFKGGYIHTQCLRNAEAIVVEMANKAGVSPTVYLARLNHKVEHQ